LRLRERIASRVSSLFNVSKITEVVKNFFIVYFISDAFVSKVSVALFDDLHKLASFTKFVMDLRIVGLVNHTFE
jgi:hypothetical protein